MATEVPPAPPTRERVSTTQHAVTINGVRIPYTAHTGTLTLSRENGAVNTESAAEFFFIAYIRDDVPAEARERRPITFSFNGGPGSSSVWMHLGLLGPRRVRMGDAGASTRPPGDLIENEHSLLDATDLVFIDPVGTGYSRSNPPDKAADFHAFTRDVESVGEFIRLFCTRHARWSSPKFVIGESYGTTRAAALSGYLQDRHGIFLNGLMLLSCVLNFQTLRFAPGNDLPYMLYVAPFAAAAWYHKRLPPALQALPLTEVVQRAGDFAGGDYWRALTRGDLLTVAEERDIAAQLAGFTGLESGFVLRHDLRVDVAQFTRELLRDEGRAIGRLDARFTGHNLGERESRINMEPSSLAYNGPYSTAMNHYARTELKFESDLPYEIMNMQINGNWRYGEFEGQYVDVGDTLRRVMCANPHLHVLVCNGWYDLATPFAATEYTFNHLRLPRALRPNVRMTYYEAGHLMYVHTPSLRQQKRDLAGFIEGAV